MGWCSVTFAHSATLGLRELPPSLVQTAYVLNRISSLAVGAIKYAVDAKVGSRYKVRLSNTNENRRYCKRLEWTGKGINLVLVVCQH